VRPSRCPVGAPIPASAAAATTAPAAATPPSTGGSGANVLVAPQAPKTATSTLLHAELGFEPDVRHLGTDLHTLLDLARGGLAVTLCRCWAAPMRDMGSRSGRSSAAGCGAASSRRCGAAAAARPAVDALLAELRARSAA
jgi:hypothetical protein